jgi:hypothetical protein
MRPSLGLRVATIVAAAGVLSACGAGSGDQVDHYGGFTTAQRSSANQALAKLGQTGIAKAAVQMTLTYGAVPALCSVHVGAADPSTYELYMLWRPLPRVGDTLTWLRASITPSGLDKDYSFTLESSRALQTFQTRYYEGLVKPYELCAILEDGSIELLGA